MINKYGPLDLFQYNQFEVLQISRVINFGLQQGLLYMWVLNESGPKVYQTYLALPSGTKIPPHATYLASCMGDDYEFFLFGINEELM